MSDDDENQHGKNNNASFTDQCESFDQTSHDTPQSANRFVAFLQNCICCIKCRRFQSSQSSQDESESENLHGKFNPILRCVALAFSRRPLLVLITTIILAFSITWAGLAEYGLPEFDDPYLGFETRSTSISNRIITLRNLKNEINQLQVLENYPGEKLSGREWRRRKRTALGSPASETPEIQDNEEDTFDFNNRDLCTSFPLEDYSRIALELKDPSNVFDYETVMLICFFQKKLEDLPSYGMLCEKDAGYECCPGWSLPNYIAQYQNKTDCAQLQKPDIIAFKNDLRICQSFYKNETHHKILDNGECGRKEGGICPPMCMEGGVLHSSYVFTLDNRFLINNESRFSMIILPIAKSSNDNAGMEFLQDEIAEIVLPKDYVFLAGYDFGGKDSTFRTYLVSDLQYVIIASILIFFVVGFYVRSVFVAIVSFGILTLSLGNAYFIYTAILQVPYFPFMNMLVTIIVMGIGTDGTLIIGSQWHRLKIKHAAQRESKIFWDTIMMELLAETTAPLIITTCTTAAAFFASLTSSITTIRCFSIFAGTATILGFILLYFSVPPALILSDLVIDYLKSLLPQESEAKGKFYLKVAQLYERTNDLCNTLNIFKKLYSYCKTIVQSHRAKCWLIVFLILVATLMWSVFVVFIDPKFQLPNTEQFQLLSNNHPIERFDRVVEPEFTMAGLSEEELGDKMTVYFIWGLQKKDTGNTLDPTDNGAMVFDEKFTLDNPANQKWMRRLCGKLKKQPFYDDVANSMVGAHYDSCFLETMIKWMKRDCEHIFFKNVSYVPCCKISKFPYESDVFSKCVGHASRDMHRTPSSYFRSDIAGPKFFVLTENVNKTNGTGDNKIGGQLATFSLRVKTNISFSLAYEKMDKFYKDVETFFNEHIQSEKIPVGLENGFFVSAHLDFYDLQTSLLRDTCQSVLLSAVLCFTCLWIFVRQFRIAVGAVLCIFSIVIVSSAILITAFNWKLGVFESIAVTVAIGLSDFTAHNSIEFSKRQSVAEMTSPTFFAAVTTIIMGLFMLTCSNVLVYQQIGAFFFVLILVSWIYSVFFLSPILAFFDYILTAIRLKRVPKPSVSIFAGGVSSSVSQAQHQNDEPLDSTVYSNTLLTSRRKGALHKNRAISEPAMHNARNSVHFGRSESTELVESPIRGGARSQNLMEQWKLLKKLGTETAV